MGLVSLFARLIDKDFRSAFIAIFILRKQNEERPKEVQPIMTTSNCLRTSINLRTDPDPKFLGVFDKLHMKVKYTQFILDSLISLSFNMSKQTIIPVDGVIS
jgi:hypothetical protein